MFNIVFLKRFYKIQGINRIVAIIEKRLFNGFIYPYQCGKMHYRIRNEFLNHFVQKHFIRQIPSYQLTKKHCPLMSGGKVVIDKYLMPRLSKHFDNVATNI